MSVCRFDCPSKTTWCSGARVPSLRARALSLSFSLSQFYFYTHTQCDRGKTSKTRTRIPTTRTTRQAPSGWQKEPSPQESLLTLQTLQRLLKRLAIAQACRNTSITIVTFCHPQGEKSRRGGVTEGQSGDEKRSDEQDAPKHLLVENSSLLFFGKTGHFPPF